MTSLRASENCSTSIRVECALFTSLKVVEDRGTVVCKCFYPAWAYSLFALVGAIFILLPLVLLLCCILRRRSKRRKFINSESTTYSPDPESPYQPLADDSEVFTNYGAVDNYFSQRGNNKDERSRHQENGSMASSHASLLPNFDETSLNARNASITSRHSFSDGSKNKPTASNQFNGRTNLTSQPSSECGLYATVDLVQSSQPPSESGLDATVDLVPSSQPPGKSLLDATVDLIPNLAANSRPVNNTESSESKVPIYDLLESPTTDDNLVQTSPSVTSSEQLDKVHSCNIAPMIEEDKSNSQVIDNFASSYLVDGPSPSNSCAAIVREEKTGAADEPFYEQENQNIIDTTENESNVTITNDLNISESDHKTVNSKDDSSNNSPPKCKCPLAEQTKPIPDSTSTGTDQEEECKPAVSTKPNCDCVTDFYSDDENISQANQLRKRLESGED